MGRPRSAARRSFPDNLYMNSAGYFSWRDPSTGKSHGLGRDKQSAFHEARQANALIAAKESKTLVERIRETDCPTLSAWTETWITSQVDERSAKTIQGYKSAFREFNRRCGHLLVSEITPKMIADVLEYYESAKKFRMAEHIQSTALELFRVAEVKGYIEVGKNPVAPTETQGGKVLRERLSLENFLKIHRAQKKPYAKLAMELALVSAQRRGDVAAMLRSDIVDGHLQVDQRKSGGQTKIGIPITLRLEAVGWSLKEIINRCRTVGLETPYLIHHRTRGGRYEAGAPVQPDKLSEKFALARDAVGILAEDGRSPPTFHEIRSLAIRLWTAQAGKEFAQALAGHRNLKTTLLYTDPRDSEVQRIMVPDPNAPAFRTNIG